MPTVVSVSPRQTGAADYDEHGSVRARTSYRLVAAEALPAVDIRRTLRQAVLGERWSKRHAAFMRRHASLSVVCYFIGVVYRFYGMIVPTRYSLGWWLTLASLLQTPSVTAVSLSLRIDIIRQLMKSFEFWFFSAVNVIWAAALVAGYGDARVSVCLLNWLETENAKLTDANLQGLHYVVATASLAIVMLLSFLTGIVFNITEIRPLVVFTTPRGHGMLVKDVLLNVMATILLLMARLVYRRRDAVRHTTATRAMLCVTCRCRLKFVPTTGKSSSSSTRSKLVATPKGTIQLESVPIHESFPASNTLLGGQRSTVAMSRWLRWCWLTVSVCALAMLVALCAAPPTSSLFLEPLATPFSVATLGLTVLTTAPFVLLHQRQLVRRLFGSFDFVFLVAQLTLAALCVNHLMDWTVHSCAATTCTWLWFYVVATFDALTPEARRLLGWTPRRAACLALFVLAGMVALALELAVWGMWHISDRVLVDWPVLGKRVRITGIPFVFSRLAILLVWQCRLVWRLASCGDDELIMLLGAVQYEAPKPEAAPAQRGAAGQTPPNAIVPVVPTTN